MKRNKSFTTSTQLDQSRISCGRTIGAGLRALRKARGRTQTYLLKALSRSVGWLRLVGSDRSDPSTPDLREINEQLFRHASSPAAKQGCAVREGAGRPIKRSSEYGLRKEVLSPDLTDDREVIHSTFQLYSRMSDPARAAFGGEKRFDDQSVWSALMVGDKDGMRLRPGVKLEWLLTPPLERHQPAAVLTKCWPSEANGDELRANRDFDRSCDPFSNGGLTRTRENFIKNASTVDAGVQRTSLYPSANLDLAISRVEWGATILGEGSEMKPGTTAGLTLRLRAAGHRIVWVHGALGTGTER